MNFFETQSGYDFLNYDMPRLIEAIEELTKAVQELNSKLPAESEMDVTERRK